MVATSAAAARPQTHFGFGSSIDFPGGSRSLAVSDRDLSLPSSKKKSGQVSLPASFKAWLSPPAPGRRLSTIPFLVIDWIQGRA